MSDLMSQITNPPMTSVEDKIVSDEKTSEFLDMCQIIYYDFKINPDIDAYLDKVNFKHIGTKYNTIAIIGPQSTGKSTLLNRLFDTKFEEMNSSVRRGQTTKGVWIAAHAGQKVLIIDCEGTDSKSRSEEDRGKFEHTSSLFALAMSDVLIVNMWTSDVGRYTASNYGVLKIVFEMNLKLFQQECAKKILIMLRDFDPKRNQKDKIEALIRDDINKIWEDIKKPEQYKNSSPENFFSFEFITLSHKIYLPDKFEAEVHQLRNRLSSDSTEYLFSGQNKDKNIPSDGLSVYINQIWNDILNEKELDIPSQREMLANYRCSEIKQNILKDYESKFKDFNLRSAQKQIDKFKEECESIKNEIISSYDRVAKNYDEKIYNQIRKQLEDAVSQKLYVAFLNQTKRLIPIIQKHMRKDLQKKLSNTKPDENYLKIAEDSRNYFLKGLINRLQEKKVYENWNVNEKEFFSIFDEIIEIQKKKCLEDKKMETIKTLKKEMQNAFFLAIENSAGNFWYDFNKLILSYFFMKILPLKVFLIEYYNLSQEETNLFLEDIQNDLYNGMKKDIIKKLKEITVTSIEFFKKKFWYEKDKEMRNWNRMEEEEIDEMFKKIRAGYISLFDSFKNFSVIKDMLSLIDLEKDEAYTEEKEKELIEKMGELLKTTQFEPLLKQNEINSIKKKFEDGISSILEEAKRRREGFSAANLPYWFYGLLIFFGYDDIFKLIKRPLILTLVLILGGVIFALVKFDKMRKVKDLYYDIEESLTKMRKNVVSYVRQRFDKY